MGDKKPGVSHVEGACTCLQQRAFERVMQVVDHLMRSLPLELSEGALAILGSLIKRLVQHRCELVEGNEDGWEIN